ncbi:glycosyltransferase [Vibrio breoganii]
MKKLLYLTFVDRELDPGVFKKIKFQVNSFIRQGYDVDFTFISGSNLYVNDTKVLYLPQTKMRKLTNRFIYPDLIRHKIIKSNYDVCYIRKSYVNLSFVFFLQKLNKCVENIVLEIPTYPYKSELKGFIKQILYYYELFSTWFLKPYISLITFYGGVVESIWSLPTVRLENGVEVESITMKNDKLNHSSSNKISLIGVGNLSEWHGFERVIKAIALDKDNDVVFHIVGEGNSYSYLVDLTEKLNVREKVIFHGFKSGPDLDLIFETCDVAIGSLGMYKINLYTGSTIKAREYTARGIPSVLGYKDLSFDSKCKFIYHVANNQEPLDLAAIIQWYNDLESTSREIREFAYNKLSWDRQMSLVEDKLLELNNMRYRKK